MCLVITVVLDAPLHSGIVGYDNVVYFSLKNVDIVRVFRVHRAFEWGKSCGAGKPYLSLRRPCKMIICWPS